MEKNFDDVAKIYDGIFKPFIRDHYLKKRAEFILKVFKPRMKILEVGCGTGLLLNILRNAGLDVYGIDSSKEMVAIATKRIPGRIFVWDVLKKMPFPENYFDGVIFIATVHHLGGMANFESSIINTLNVLKERGKILIWDHNPMNLYWRFIMKKVPQDTGREILLSAKEIIEVFKKHHIKNYKILRKGLVPDFTNEYFLRFFVFLERKIEFMPIIRNFLAHNVIIGEKCGEIKR